MILRQNVDTGGATIFRAWQCIGCGRIDGPQNCLGVCEDRKAEFVYAAEYAETLARAKRAEERARSLEALVRRIATITPHEDAFRAGYLSLQADARRVLAAEKAVVVAR